MKSAIKKLEEIGQTTSAKQFSTLEDMLDAVNLDNESAIKLKSKENELIAFLLPEDDSDDNADDNADNDDAEE